VTRGSDPSYGAVSPTNLNYAVTAALTDSNKISLTDAQKAAAQEVFGVGGPITEIPAATSEYTLSEGIFKHAPTNAPTYNLPSITDTIRSHVIVLAIDFSSVQTFSFVPPQDSGVTFQSYANPNQGDVWVFRCVWYGGKWRICPMKIKNCVTRQLTSGALSITDAVAGDALALKMTAPRSVVVNQLVVDVDNWSLNTGYSVLVNNATVTKNNHVFRVDGTNTENITTGFFVNISNSIDFVNGHKYLIGFNFVSNGINNGCKLLAKGNNGQADVSLSDTYDTTITPYILTFAGTTGNYRLSIIQASSANVLAPDWYVTASLQIVDLTQYFNGDSTLIDSITSWDDLVAYDPRFASYVEYNTGTVEGVTPQVNVTGKNLLNPQVFVDNGAVLQSDGSYYYASASTANGLVVFQNKTGYQGQFALSLNIKYVAESSSIGVTIRFNYTDGTRNSIGLVTVDGAYHAVTLVSNANKVVASVSCSYGSSSTQTHLKDIQLELGSTATVYEPYHDGGTAQAPAPLFAVGNAADEFEAVSGVTTRKMGSFTLTGTENFSWSNTLLCANIIYNNLGISEWAKKVGGANSICNTLQYSSRQSIASVSSGYFLGDSYNPNNQNLLFIKIDGCESANDVKTWLTNHPTTIYYELATPTTTQGTPTQISLQAGNNVAMHTDGGRLAPIDITYESNEI
jgi:hypothetical protein